MRQVPDAATGLGSGRTKEIAGHPDVSLSERQVRAQRHALAER